MAVHRLTFNDFSENTYVLADEAGEAVVIDPGMSDGPERETFDSFLRQRGLTLTACWLTHAHVDHVLGLPHVFTTYGLRPRLHPGEEMVYRSNPNIAAAYGIPLGTLPEPIYDLADGKSVVHGESTLTQVLAPGHSPASVCFYDAAGGYLIGGDVLFRESIGRTDLPGGDHETLLRSVRTRIYPLPPETVVWPGHGAATTIAHERAHNPFVRA